MGYQRSLKDGKKNMTFEAVLSKVRFKRAYALKPSSKCVERFASLYVRFNVVIKVLRQT